MEMFVARTRVFSTIPGSILKLLLKIFQVYNIITKIGPVTILGRGATKFIFRKNPSSWAHLGREMIMS